MKAKNCCDIGCLFSIFFACSLIFFALLGVNRPLISYGTNKESLMSCIAKSRDSFLTMETGRSVDFLWKSQLP